MLKEKLRRVIQRIMAVIAASFQTSAIRQATLQREVRDLQADIARKMPDNPAVAGYKVYSQVDEDGIIEEIFRRIGSGSKVLVEIGCGNGLENNTHAALLAGWRGSWIDGSESNIEFISRTIPLESARLHVRREFVTRDNAAKLITDAMTRFQVSELDLLSLDIDGNDLYVLQAILEKTQPRVIIVEYNGKFVPPLSVAIAYNPTHGWAYDDYYGASLQAFVNAMPGYTLVSCNIAGANAFFVRNDFASHFTAYPIKDLFQVPRFYLIEISAGADSSLKMLKNVLAG